MAEDSSLDPLKRHETFISQILAKKVPISGDDLRENRFHRPKDIYAKMPAEWRQAESRKPQPKKLSRPRSDFVEILRRALGHIAANPSVPANVTAMGLSYKFPDEVDVSDFSHFGIGDDITVVNKSEDDARRFFVETLGDAARQAARDFRRRLGGHESADTSTDAIFRQDKFLLIGERGIGKTFYLNYLISQFSSELHQKRIILVRLDLTKDTDEDLSIDDWLHWKICKILFTYYDAGSFDRDAMNDVDDPKFAHFVEKERLELLFNLDSRADILFEIARGYDTELTRVEFSKAFREVASKLRSVVDTKPRQIPHNWFFPMIWDYIVSMNECSFIVIFDGLDQLGLTDHDRDRYEALVDAVNSYLGSEKSLYTASLVTMRPKSWVDRIGDDNFRHNFQHVVVAAPENKAILAKKKDYYTEPAFFDHRHEVVGTLGEHYSPSIDRFTRAFVEFVTMSLTKSVSPSMPEVSGASRSIDVGHGILTQIFGENKRKTFQALADLAEFFAAILSDDFERMLSDTVNVSDFFENYQPGSGINVDLRGPYSDIMRYNYLVIEALMLESPRENFRQEKYGYLISEDGQISSAAKSDQSINHYLHNIFHFVCNPTKKERNHVFLGVRILQVALLNSSVDRSDLIEFLSDMFEYDPKIVEQKFLEMRDDGLLEHKLDSPHVFVDSYSITFAGRYILERLMHSIEYVCMGVQTVPLPYDLVSSGYFSVRPHSSAEFVVYNKVAATLNFVRYLRQVELEEERIYSKNQKANLDATVVIPEAELSQVFGISSKISASVSRAVSRIIQHAHDSELSSQISQLDTLLPNDACDQSLSDYFGKSA